MARAIIGGRSYTVAPFKLRELRAAAPHIDTVAALAAAGGLSTVAGVAAAARDMLAVLAVGIEGATLERLEAEASLAELAGLRETFDQVLLEAGLKRPDPGLGEGAPAAPGDP
ncbi:MAG: hypothetical protein ACYDD1_15840 [Caulobacteraceae bacterium]